MDFVNGTSIEKLLSNCPILQELSLIHCGGLEQEVLCIAHLALKNLHIDLCYFGKSKVKIHAPNLSSISYGAELPADLVIDSSPSLLEADIGLYNNCGKHRAKKIIKLFEKLSYVKFLTMSINSFQNLIHLEVSSEFDCMTMATFFRLLQLSPYLESIVFAKASHLPFTSNIIIFFILSIGISPSH
ncbi:hypothetical protein MKX03_032977 [Papaver bracteatum]|nr:hypothetical protein MKX03_032977 [Papaver bracteatum]